MGLLRGPEADEAAAFPDAFMASRGPEEGVLVERAIGELKVAWLDEAVEEDAMAANLKPSKARLNPHLHKFWAVLQR